MCIGTSYYTLLEQYCIHVCACLAIIVLFVHNYLYVDIPSCPTSCTESRNEDFTTVSVSCQQPPNTPPVTSTTVTYCSTSSPNCGDSMNCTTSTCNISGLNVCEDYQLTVVPNNNCGSPTGCTGNSVMSEGQG